jgi:putative flippase GtrA
MSSPVDLQEFIRFFITGVTATVGNITAVWIVRHYTTFQIALIAGLAAGFTVSFVLSKVFAFRSRSWERAPGEALRFLAVYALGALIYWIVGILVGHSLLASIMPLWQAELGGAIVGASTMTVTSYFGHRFFTYRTFDNNAKL